MSGASKIEWCETTWNPTTGCDRVSPGCDHCYAMSLAKRLKAMGSAKYQTDGDPKTSGPGFGVACHDDELGAPGHWTKPRLVFVNSMSDLFHPDVPEQFIVKVFDVMANNYCHTFQVLTKRPRRMAAVTRAYYDGAFIRDWDRGPLGPAPFPNVWLGTSIENDSYTWRTSPLAVTPAAIRFVSLEPLLTRLPTLHLEGIDWCIVGGESGVGARPLDLDWIREVRDHCEKTGTALFVKQLGSVWGRTAGAGGKGGDPARWPDDLQIRQWPQKDNP